LGLALNAGQAAAEDACTPGKTKRIVEIKLPRPRTSEIVGSDDFGRYVAQIWNDLREEATKGLKDDEARMARGNNS